MKRMKEKTNKSEIVERKGWMVPDFPVHLRKKFMAYAKLAKPSVTATSILEDLLIEFFNRKGVKDTFNAESQS